MDNADILLDLIGQLKRKVDNARATGESLPMGTAIQFLRQALEQFTPLPRSTYVQPSRADIRKTLLTDPIALKIQEIWSDNRRIIDVRALAADSGVTVKNPTLDHVVTAYYQKNALHELAGKLEAIVRADGSRARKDMFQQWRGELRTLTSQEIMAHEIKIKITDQGLALVRSFAEHLGARDPNTRRKLAKNATETSYRSGHGTPMERKDGQQSPRRAMKRTGLLERQLEKSLCDYPELIDDSLFGIKPGMEVLGNDYPTLRQQDSLPNGRKPISYL